jgi:catechol 2,3-dioxygenase-like lactoylglutathione lyase family enzyme
MISWKTAGKKAAVKVAIVASLVATASSQLFAQQPVQRPKILGISHVGFYVSDLPKALWFWDDFLGYAEPYDLKKKDGSVRIAFIKINDHQHIELFNEHTKEPGLYFSHIAFIVSNAEQMREYLASKGIAVKPKVGKGRTGDLNFEIKDPDGHLVEFVQPEPDGMEAQHKGESLPSTRISAHIMHVGFTVGDSQKAIDFYGKLLGFKEFWRGSSSGRELNWINMRVPNGTDYVEFMLYKKMPPQSKWGVKNHVSLMVRSVPKAVDILESRPAYKTYLDYQKPLKMQVGVNQRRQVNIFDPDGTRIELMEPKTVTGKPTPSSTAPAPVPDAAN